MRTWLGIAAAALVLAGSRPAVEAAPRVPLTELRALDDGWQVLALAFSPDGRTLATGNADRTAKWWNVRAGELERTLPAEPGVGSYVQGVAFTPNGRGFLSLVGGDVTLWDARTAEAQRTFSRGGAMSGRLMCLAVSPDGKSVAAGGSSGLGGTLQYPSGKVGLNPGQVWVWDLGTGLLRQVVNLDEGLEVVSLAFSPDGKLLAGGSQAGTVGLWNTTDFSTRPTLPAHGGPVWALAFSPDGKRLASGGADHLVQLWNPLTGGNQRTLKGHEHLVLSLAFSPNGKTLASGSYDQTLKLWEPGTGALAGTLPLPGWVHALQFSPDGKLLAAGLRAQHGALRLWRLDPAPPLAGL
jgi:WD40 repeat protein